MDTNSYNSGAVGWFRFAGFASQLRNFPKSNGRTCSCGFPMIEVTNYRTPRDIASIP